MGREREASTGMENREDEGIVEGRNAVYEVLKSDRTVEKLFVSEGSREGSLQRIVALAKEKKVVIHQVEKARLDRMSQTGSHQGVIALVTPKGYVEPEDILNVAGEKGEHPFIVICDGITDPHNLGAVLRTADACGAHGVIIPKRRSVSVNATVYKTSAGAAEYVPVARVTNISAAIDDLKEKGLWIYGADMTGTPYDETDFSGPVALVIGSEGEGISRLVKEKCDFLVKIPMLGEVSSLNASVACGILMYEVTRNRKKASLNKGGSAVGRE